MTNFSRSVKLKMTRNEINNFVPKHKGLDFNFYAPIVDGRNLFTEKGYDKSKIDWVDVTITASDINPNPLHSRNMRDIDEELAIMDSKYKIIKDRLTHTDNKDLIHLKQPENTFTRHATVMQHPYLKDNDHLKSKATEVHKTELPLSEVREWEQKFEKRKAFYSKPKFDEYTIKKDKDGNKLGVFDMGYIGN